MRWICSQYRLSTLLEALIIVAESSPLARGSQSHVLEPDVPHETYLQPCVSMKISSASPRPEWIRSQAAADTGLQAPSFQGSNSDVCSVPSLICQPGNWGIERACPTPTLLIEIDAAHSTLPNAASAPPPLQEPSEEAHVSLGS